MLWHVSVTGCQGSMVACNLALRRISQQQTCLVAGSLFVDPSSIFQNYWQSSFCVGARNLAPIVLSFYVQGTRTWLHACLCMLAKLDIFCLPFPHVVFVLFLSRLSLSSNFLMFICNSIIVLMCKLPYTLDVSSRSFTIGIEIVVWYICPTRSWFCSEWTFLSLHVHSFADFKSANLPICSFFF